MPSISQPRTYSRPTWDTNGADASKPSSILILARTVSRKHTSCLRRPAHTHTHKHTFYIHVPLHQHSVATSFSPYAIIVNCSVSLSHSFLTLSATLRSTVISARTRDGLFSPTFGWPTSTTEKEPMCRAILAQPANCVSPSGVTHGLRRVTTSSRSSRISSDENNICTDKINTV